MTLLRPLRAVLLALLAAAATSAAFAAPGPLPSAGGRTHAVVALPRVLNPAPRPPSVTPGGPRPILPEEEDDAALYHIPAELAPGAIRPGVDLRRTPTHIAAHDERVIFAYPAAGPSDPEAQPGPARRHVESFSIATLTEGFYVFEPAGRDPETLPALPAWGTLDAFICTAQGPVALLRDATGAHSPTMLALRGVQWVPAPLPRATPEQPAPSITLPWRLLVVDERVALIEHPADGALARVWWTTGKALAQAADAPGSAAGAIWTLDALPAPRRDESLVSAAGQIIAFSKADDDTVTLRLLRPGSFSDPPVTPVAATELGVSDVAAYVLSSVPGVGLHYAVVPTADRVNVLWLRDGDRRWVVTSVSAVTGRTLHEGFALTDPVITGAQLQRMVLLLGVVLLTVMLFVLRPEAAASQLVTLPPDSALADPGRRFLAGAIDLIIPMAACALIFHVPLTDLAAAMAFSSSASLRAFVVFLVAVSLAIVHSALAEALTGRTIGKALLRCRAVSIKARPLSVWQALVRNTLKWLFPPLALLMLVDPSRRHPADVAARSVVIAPTRAAPPERPERPEPPEPPETPEPTKSSEAPETREPR